ncbi:hypothetical protein QTP70_018125 [Hemibagrus guttatus]|uniref:Craniofacial development protein 2-like n=1 Tax=Hemibagrus guttatus TaxID=175788 RepID=A0AAE0QST4_9TELE|nr:hypothetical protein QTP70_018125 [Hemibagrus guttatus]
MSTAERRRRAMSTVERHPPPSSSAEGHPPPSDIHHRAAVPRDIHCRAAAPSDIHRRVTSTAEQQRRGTSTAEHSCRALALSDVHRRTIAPSNDLCLAGAGNSPRGGRAGGREPDTASTPLQRREVRRENRGCEGKSVYSFCNMIAADPSTPRVSDRVMNLKLEIEGVMLNVVSGYAPQVGCELEEKERFWSELDEVMESIPTGERVVIGADFNGHVGEGNRGNEEVMGKFGVKEKNLEGQMIVGFAKRMDMAVVNTYFQKREEHRVTYKSGGRSTQVDYILCRRGKLKEISDCKVVVGESVARQHRMVVCRMTLMVCKKKRSKIEIKKTKWWKLKKEECCEEFRQKLRQALGGQVVLPEDWETTAEVIRETGRKVLGVSSGRRKEGKETWWWNEEVQDSVQRKRLAKKKWDMDRTEENRQEYKELQRRVKREVSKAKQKAYDKLYTRLDTREGEKDLYRLARQRD